MIIRRCVSSKTDIGSAEIIGISLHVGLVLKFCLQKCVLNHPNPDVHCQYFLLHSRQCFPENVSIKGQKTTSCYKVLPYINQGSAISH